MPDIELKPLVLNPAMNITKISTLEGMHELVSFLAGLKEVGFDVETDPKRDFYWRRCRTIQFGNSTKQFLIDLLDICGSPDELFKSQGNYGANMCPNLKVVIDLLAPFLCTDKLTKVGVMLGFEYMTFYWCLGQRIFGLYCCSMVEKCIWAGMDGQASMKNYSYYGMAEMMGRYFGVIIEKELQESFDLETPLTNAQMEYACIDVRTPLSIKAAQAPILAGLTPASAEKQGLLKVADRLKTYDQLILGDDLREIAQVENCAIGAFEDMHIHGERLDRDRWKKRVDNTKIELQKALDELDTYMLPAVGSKYENITQEQIDSAKAKWKAFTIVSPEETTLKAEARKEQDPERKTALLLHMQKLEAIRKAQKDILKKEESELGKRRTVIKNLAADCAGKALINYGSPKQLLEVLTSFKGLSTLKATGDDVLEKFIHIPVIAALQKYRGLSKEISTYGDSWITEWTTKPSKEEGWLHPGDGKLHCVYNQYDAETGRSSSEKPNGQNLPQGEEYRFCFIADPPDEIAPEGYVYVTADMSGAELRIIADRSGDPTWIGCFERGEDVHSVSTEILNPDTWPGMALPDCAYFKLKPDGVTPYRKKCKCPEHKEKRNEGKAPNFLLAYGGGAGKLASELKKEISYCKELMRKHEKAFPNIWAYLEKSGRRAQMLRKAFDMWNRRRLFPEPTWKRAVDKAKSDREEKLHYPYAVCKQNVETFFLKFGRKPKKDERYVLEHREPTNGEIGNAFQALGWAMERQGKNHEIQGTNATIAKVAMGAGYDLDGKPFLWHVLPKYHAKLVKFVHDELVVMCPARYGQQVADAIGDAFKRAAALKMKKVVMEFDYHIGPYWCK